MGNSLHPKECFDYKKVNNAGMQSFEDVAQSLCFFPPYWKKKGGTKTVSRRLTGVLSKLYLLYVSESLVVFRWPYGPEEFKRKHLNSIKKKAGERLKWGVLVKSHLDNYYLLLSQQGPQKRVYRSYSGEVIHLLSKEGLECKFDSFNTIEVLHF